MKSGLSLLYFLCIFISTKAKNSALSGIWITENKDAKVEIFKDGNFFSGKIIWLINPKNAEGVPKMDRKNPDQKLRNQPILGLKILEGLEPQDGEFINGRIYSPEKGMYAHCKIKWKDIHSIELTITKGFITLHKIWKKEV